MTFNPDLARERIRFLHIRIEDVGNLAESKAYFSELDWWEAQLRRRPGND